MKETDRLILRALTHNQLLKFINNDHSLEKELNLSSTNKDISKSLHDVLAKSVLPNVDDKDRDYLYNTIWIIISKDDNKIVGDISFVGEPDPEGEIEIGYSTYEDFRGRGFMTEAVGGIVDWARTQSRVKSIFAATQKNNTASYAILEKNGFRYIGEVDDMLSWKMNLS